MQICTVPVGPLETNCYLVWEEKENAVLIDPGAEPDRILEAVIENGVTPTTLLLTHAHFDHIGAVALLKQRYDLKVVIEADDEELLADPIKNQSATFGLAQPSFSADRVVVDGDLVAAGSLTFEVLHTPGHSKGSCVYLCENAMFSGDTLFWNSVGRTDFYGGDSNALRQSLKRLAALEGDYTVYPGHGPETTLEDERRSNPFLGAEDDPLS